jgi:phosphatidylethanolamine/phosphatidyl-N-methylethanolamine N-methyltransferase
MVEASRGKSFVPLISAADDIFMTRAGSGCIRQPGIFDVVVAQFVITLVANPERVLDECARVLGPGGEIILVNHFYSERGMAAKVEDSLAKVARPLGLRPEFPFARIAGWAEAHGGVAIVERRKITPFKVFTLVRIKKR